MRQVSPILLFMLITSTGCSSWIACRGKDLDSLSTREEVHREFGKPIQSGCVDGQQFEEYRTKEKVAEKWKTINYSMGDVVTFGLGELVWFPRELYGSARQRILGQTIRFVYDEQDNIRSVRIDNQPFHYSPVPQP